MPPLLALVALVAAQVASSPPPTSATDTPTVDSPAAVTAAQRFLMLIDTGQWRESYAATGERFHRVNTLRLWTDTSRQVRAPLGAMIARSLIGNDLVPAPPHGFQNVKFRTQFANRTVVETVTLDRERGAWRVVGIVVD